MAVRNWLGLFLMGAINNLPYVIVNSAASTIADSFDKKNLVGVIFGANVSLSMVVKSLNAFVLLKVSYRIRYILNGCVMLIGLFGIAYAFDFWFAIICIAIVGSTAAFGENLTLGYLSNFPSSLVNAWSSGTGMAGLLGSSIYIIFGCVVGNGSDKAEKLHDITKYAFLLTTPVVLIYWLAYFVIVQRPKSDQGTDQSEDGQVDPISGAFNGKCAGALVDASNIQNDQSNSGDESPLMEGESACLRVWRCFKLVFWLGINLAGVYVFEYVARGCAAKVRPSHEYHIGCPELYAALQLCYQAGVFVSRSSVQMFRIKRVEILTLIQLINMVLWVVDVHYKFLPVAILPALMIFVGLLGGASYVNIFYSLLHENTYPKQDTELCINITGLFINLGILLGTGLETALFTTLLHKD